jgi:hypothetical protein
MTKLPTRAVFVFIINYGGERMPAKLSDKKREIAKAAICINPDISGPQLAKIVGISKSTAHYLRDEIINDDIGVDNFEILREQKKAEFIQEAWDTVKRIHLKINEKLDTLDLEQLKKVNIRDLAVALGTIYDKQALASGEPTQISERKEPTPELVSELEKKVQKLKQLTG